MSPAVIHIVVSSSTSGWDIAAAVGSLLGAAAAVFAGVVALIIARRDRLVASQAAKAQMEAAAERAAREHEIELLIQLTEQIGIRLSYSMSAPQGQAAEAVAKGLALALPDTRHMPALLAALGLKDDAADAETFEAKYKTKPVPSNAAPSSYQLAQSEIGDRIKIVAAK